MKARTVLTVSVLAMGAVLPRSARAADPDPAQVLFDQGLADMEASRFEKACPAIEQSYKLDPLPGTLFTLAECEAKRGRTATALGRYEEYLALFARLPPERRAKQGDRDQVSLRAMTMLGPQVPELTVRLSPSAPPGTRVTRDGAPLSESALGVPMPLDPGEHVFTLQPPGGPVTERRVTINTGEKKAILLDLKLEAPPTPVVVKTPAPAPPARDSRPVTPVPAPRSSLQKTLGFVGIGVGGAGLVMGAVAGGIAISKHSAFSKTCPGGDCVNQQSAVDSYNLAGNLSTAGFVAGGVVALTGVVLVITAPKAGSAKGAWIAPVVGAGYLGAEGRF